MTAHDIFDILNRSSELERIAANNGLRLPIALGINRRRLRSALLRASAPDAHGLFDRLLNDTATLIAAGRAVQTLQARRGMAVAYTRPSVPDALTSEILDAFADLKSAVKQAEATVYPAYAPPRPRRVRSNAGGE